MTQKYCQNTKHTRKDPAVRQEPEKESIFGPETKPERLEEFLSLCMNQKVKIVRVVPGNSVSIPESISITLPSPATQG